MGPLPTPIGAVHESRKREKDGRYVIKMDRGIHGTINGGGPELTLKTFNGDIVLRAAESQRP